MITIDDLLTKNRDNEIENVLHKDDEKNKQLIMITNVVTKKVSFCVLDEDDNDILTDVQDALDVYNRI